LFIKTLTFISRSSGYWHRHVVRLSVCIAVHCGSQGRCTGLKFVPACF